MGTIVDELKEKIVASGGDATGIQTVSEALDKLPTGGAGGILVVSGSYQVDPKDENQPIIVANKTAKEIYDAILRNDFVVLITSVGDSLRNILHYLLTEGDYDPDDGFGFMFETFLNSHYNLFLGCKNENDYPYGNEPVG